MKKLMYALVLLLFASIISCAPKVNKTFGFDRIKDFQDLSGSYSGTSVNSKRHLAEFNILESFFVEGEKAEKFTLSFSDENTVIVTYQVIEEGSTIDKTLELKGKMQKDGFYIDLERSRILIPFVFGKESLTRIILGRNPKGQLIVKSYHGNTTGALSVSKSSYYEDVRVFEEQ